MRRGPARPPQPRGAPRPQAEQHPGDPRRHREAARLRHREAAGRRLRRRRDRPHRLRLPGDDRGLRQPGAGAGRLHHHRERRLFARDRALRAADRPAALRGGSPLRGRDGAGGVRAGAAPSERGGGEPPRRGVAVGRAGQHRAHGAAQGAGPAILVGRAARRRPPALSRRPADQGPARHRRRTASGSSSRATGPARSRWRSWCRR